MLYSIGHGARPLAAFLHLLQRCGIRAVADVRSRPGSRFHPQYNRSALEAALAEAGIGYHFLGDTMGGRPEDPALRDAAGAPDYKQMRQQPSFAGGLTTLLRLDGTTGPVAMVCSERDPRTCHRSRLIGAALLEQNVDTTHIDTDGRLVAQSRLGLQPGLF